MGQSALFEEKQYLRKRASRGLADQPHRFGGLCPRRAGTSAHARRPVDGGLVHHSVRGVQYVSIKYSERLAAAGIEPSVGSVGDSYDNALAETVIGLFKTEVIHRRGPSRSFDAVEYATLEWVDWFNNRRLLEPIGNIPPAEAEANYYATLEVPRMGRVALNKNSLRKIRGSSVRLAVEPARGVAEVLAAAHLAIDRETPNTSS